MTRAIADTSVFIAREAGRALGELPGEVAVSVITAAELELGVLRASDPSSRAMRLATLSRVRAAYPLLPIDGATASCFARLAGEQLRAGRKPRRHDTLDRGDGPAARRRGPHAGRGLRHVRPRAGHSRLRARPMTPDRGDRLVFTRPPPSTGFRSSPPRHLPELLLVDGGETGA